MNDQRRKLARGHGFSVVGGILIECVGIALFATVLVLALIGLVSIGIAVFNPAARAAMSDRWHERAVEQAGLK